MQKLLVAVCGTALMMTGCNADASSSSKDRVVEKANIPGHGASDNVIEVLKSGKKLETVSCDDFNMLDESFKPRAITYAASYDPKGKAHPTMTVSGTDSIMPVVVTSCRERPGDHFVSAVRAALKR